MPETPADWGRYWRGWSGDVMPLSLGTRDRESAGRAVRVLVFLSRQWIARNLAAREVAKYRAEVSRRVGRRCGRTRTGSSASKGTAPATATSSKNIETRSTKTGRPTGRAVPSTASSIHATCHFCPASSTFAEAEPLAGENANQGRIAHTGELCPSSARMPATQSSSLA